MVKVVHSAGDDEEGHPIYDCGDLQNLDEHELAVGERNVISKVEKQGERLGEMEGDDFRHGRVRNLHYGSETLVCVHVWNYKFSKNLSGLRKLGYNDIIGIFDHIIYTLF